MSIIYWTMQEALLELPRQTNGLRDSAFAKNRSMPVHRWVPWIAGFSAQFVEDCINRYLPHKTAGAWLLDPFAGVGTTLVEGFVHGLNVVGFEINPYAVLAARVKLGASNIDSKALKAHIVAFRRFMALRTNSGNGRPRSAPPSGFSGRTQLFSPAVERKILLALDFINAIPIPTIRDLFRVALGSVMVSVSNYSYEPSLTRRVAVDKEEIKDAPVADVIADKLTLMLNDTTWLQERMRKLRKRPTWKVYGETFFNAAARVRRSDFVDLLVTSPPYLNNYHYPRNTRPQLHWLGLASGPGYEGAHESLSFGKFWQTVRDKDPVNLDFDLPELRLTIDLLRDRNKEKGPYGGPGWANYVATYFNDAYRFCEVTASLLKPGYSRRDRSVQQRRRSQSSFSLSNTVPSKGTQAHTCTYAMLSSPSDITAECLSSSSSPSTKGRILAARSRMNRSRFVRFRFV
jgi:hypothetical protein